MSLAEDSARSSQLGAGCIEPGLRKAFVLAGNATLTLQGRDKRFTFKIEKNKKVGGAALFWVYVLAGPNNETDYRFLGGITPTKFYVSDRSTIKDGADSAKAFGWFWRHPEDSKVVVLHSGTCGRCGRPLTTPESIRTGLGPVCGRRDSRAEQDFIDAAADGDPNDVQE